jgi:hypothetical protein
MAPLLLTRLDPVASTATIMIVNVGVAAFQLRLMREDADWAVMRPVTIAGCLAAPFGFLLVTRIDADAVKTAVALVVLACTAALAARVKLPVRIEGKRGGPLLGGVSGLLFALGGVGGPPVVLGMLASALPARTVRGSLVLYFSVVQTVSLGVMAVSGLVSFADVQRGLLLLVPYTLGNLAGNRLLTPRTEPAFRAISFLVLAGVGLYALVA